MTSNEVASALWAADPHEFGPGKVHLVDAENSERTLCGKWLRAVPGKLTNSGRATCKICLNAVENRKHNRLMEEERQREHLRSEAERAAKDREWWAWYNRYLKSPEWRERTALVKRRAGGMCEGCGIRPLAEIHHLTYAHVGNEFLWELRAVCKVCHERIHGENG